MTSHGGRAGFVALVATLVIACGGTVPSTSPSTATSTSPSSTRPSSPPDSSPGSPQPSTNPSADPTGTPAPQEGWIQLAAATHAVADWSPDAAHVLLGLATAGDPPENQRVQVMERDGSVVRSFDGLSVPVWLDSQRFVAYRLQWEQDESGEWFPATGPNSERLGEAVLGTVDSDTLQDLELPLYPAVTSGHGTLALTRFDQPESPATAVWSDEGLTDWRQGYPLAWSAPGDRLALIHPRGEGVEPGGWLEVVEWPGLALAWSDESLTVGTADFDPTGTYLAYPEFIQLPTPPRQVPEFDLVIHAVELATGTDSQFTARENGDFAWLADGRILGVGFDSLQASVYDLAGVVLAEEAVLGPNVIASAEGQTALFYDAELDVPEMQVLRGDELTLLESPGLITGQAPQLARDGSGLLVIARAPTDAPTGSPATVLVHAL